MGSAREDAEHALAHPTSPHGQDHVFLSLARAYLGALEELGGANKLAASFVARHATACAENARLRAEVERLRSLLGQVLRDGPDADMDDVLLCEIEDALTREEGEG